MTVISFLFANCGMEIDSFIPDITNKLKTDDTES